MKINGIAVNAAGMTAAGGVRENRNQILSERGMFGPECRVTISRQGRDLSGRQMDRDKTGVRNTQSSGEVRALLRKKEEVEQMKDLREEYRRELNGIDEKITEYNASYASLEMVMNDQELEGWESYKNSKSMEQMKQAVEDLRELKKAMQEQKDFQTEDGQKKIRDAQQMAMQQLARYQEEIGENNRDLITLLKTIREAQKAENGEESENSSAAGGEDCADDTIRDSAAQFMASSVRQEKGLEERLTGAGEFGRYLVDTADAVTQSVLQRTADIREALDNEAVTDEKIEEMMQSFREEIKKDYMDVRCFRSVGLDVLRQVRDAKIAHIADNTSEDMQKTKDGMMQAAADAAIGKAMQGGLDKTSKELADEVQELIDERNGVEKTPQEKEEGKTEQNGKPGI